MIDADYTCLGTNKTSNVAALLMFLSAVIE